MEAEPNQTLDGTLTGDHSEPKVVVKAGAIYECSSRVVTTGNLAWPPLEGDENWSATSAKVDIYSGIRYEVVRPRTSVSYINLGGDIKRNDIAIIKIHTGGWKGWHVAVSREDMYKLIDGSERIKLR